MANAAEDVEQYRKLYMNTYACVTVNWQNQFSMVSHYLVNLNMCMPKDPEFPLIGILPKEMHMCIRRHTEGYSQKHCFEIAKKLGKKRKQF